MKLKPGVRLLGLKPELWAVIHAADPIWTEYVAHGVTVTSVVDGTHSRASEHYTGLAMDLRTSDLPPAAVGAVHHQLQAALGEDFDVILEENHIHAEYDPKQPY